MSEITTRHIRRLVQSASDFLGRKIEAAVISIPTNFGDEQIAALNQAAKAAEIEVLQFISEPTAALLAYDARPESKLNDKVTVVADFGGTRSDIAVIASRGGIYTILSTIHDYETAGKQLDQVLIDHFAKEFLKKHKGAGDPRENPKSLAKLALEAESTKKSLSIGSNAALSIEALSSGIDFSATINRTRYEMLSSKTFASLTRLITEAISKANLDILDIDEVILSGGTSHTPRLAGNLSSTFSPSSSPQSKKTVILAPSTSPTALDPSTLAARGAAIQASLISTYDKADIDQNTHPMCTVTPHLSNALGVLLITGDPEKGLFQPVIERETAVPCRRTSLFTLPPPPKTVAAPALSNGDTDGTDSKSSTAGVLIRVVEAAPSIKETVKPKPEKKKKVPTAKETDGSDADEDSDLDSDSDDEDDDDDDDESRTHRESIWKVGTTLAELAIYPSSPSPEDLAKEKENQKEKEKEKSSKSSSSKSSKSKDTKNQKEKRSKIEVTIDVTADLAVTVTAREVGGGSGGSKGGSGGGAGTGTGGVRAKIEASNAAAGEVKENGST